MFPSPASYLTPHPPHRRLTLLTLITRTQHPSPAQWIHKAGAQTSFGGPIAHGFLSLSLLPALLESVLPPQPWAEGVRPGRRCRSLTRPSTHLPTPVPGVRRHPPDVLNSCYAGPWDVGLALNCGFNRVRFVAPVRVGGLQLRCSVPVLAASSTALDFRPSLFELSGIL